MAYSSAAGTVINLADMALFIEAYDAANGAGAFAALTAGVPEPTSIALMHLAVAAAVCRRGRHRLASDLAP